MAGYPPDSDPNRIHLFYDPDGKPITAEQWSELRENTDLPRVALTELDDYWISTVWLGLNQSAWAGEPVMIYETMAFKGNGLDQAAPRRIYATREQAEAGHAEVVAEIQQLMSQ